MLQRHWLLLYHRPRLFTYTHTSRVSLNLTRTGERDGLREIVCDFGSQTITHTHTQAAHTHNRPQQAFLRPSDINLFLSWGPDKSPRGALIITSLSNPSPSTTTHQLQPSTAYTVQHYVGKCSHIFFRSKHKIIKYVLFYF